ncbi:unnamed protein product, partial [Ectocarpus sp. 12 AP-2014]
VVPLLIATLTHGRHCPSPTSRQNELRKQSSHHQQLIATQQCSPTRGGRPYEKSLASASSPQSAPRLLRPCSNGQPAAGTASA